MHHSALQERQSDESRAGCTTERKASDVGTGLFAFIDKLEHVTTDLQVGLHKPWWITAASPRNNLEHFGFISQPLC